MKNKILPILATTLSLVASCSIFANENLKQDVRAFSRIYTPYLLDSYTKVMEDSNTFPNDDTIRVYFEKGADPTQTETLQIKVTEYMAFGEDRVYYETITEGNTGKVDLQKAGNNFRLDASNSASGQVKLVVSLGSQ